jgi:L-ascorbate peroxidase
VRNVLSKVKAAGMLRLAFHDAGTFDIADKSGGMNGSIIYEVDRPENTGLNKSIKVLGKAKEVIDLVQQGTWFTPFLYVLSVLSFGCDVSSSTHIPLLC